MATTATAAKTTPLTRKCQARGTCRAAAAVPMSPPITAPTLHRACMELIIEVPARRWTRSPWAFWAVSTTASSTPATNSPAPNTASTGTEPATNTAAARSTEPTAAVRAVPNRRRTGAGSGPATTPPIGNAITASPYAALESSNMSLNSGSRGSRLEKIAPFVRNSRDTASRARRMRARSMASGSEDVTRPGYGARPLGSHPVSPGAASRPVRHPRDDAAAHRPAVPRHPLRARRFSSHAVLAASFGGPVRDHAPPALGREKPRGPPGQRCRGAPVRSPYAPDGRSTRRGPGRWRP